MTRTWSDVNWRHVVAGWLVGALIATPLCFFVIGPFIDWFFRRAP